MKSLRRLLQSASAPLLVLLLADTVVAAASLVAGAWLRFGFDFDLAERTLGGGTIGLRAAGFALCVVTALLTMGLYRARQRPTVTECLARVLVGVALGGLAYVLLFYLVPPLNTGRLTLAIAVTLTFVLVSAIRIVLLKLLDHNPAKRRVLLIGSGRVASKVGMLRRRSDRRRFDVIGFVPGNDTERRFAEQNGTAPLLDPDHDFGAIQFDEIVVALDDRRGMFPTERLLKHRSRGIPVRDIVEFLENETGKIDLDVMRPGWLIFSASGHSRWNFQASKRVIDLAVAVCMLLVTTPLLLAAIASIRIEGGMSAPLFYRQRRVGLGGRVFELLKFRSMRPDAEADGPQWSAVRGDDRVTRAGRWMRRFRVDELPQLVNVLRGEMSIVGPRPERPEFVEKICERISLYDYRHCVRPGLTGWAQLNFPYGASIEDAGEKLKYDLYYIKNTSIVFDLVILMQTLEVVLWGRTISMAGPRVVHARSERATERPAAVMASHKHNITQVESDH